MDRRAPVRRVARSRPGDRNKPGEAERIGTAEADMAVFQIVLAETNHLCDPLRDLPQRFKNAAPFELFHVRRLRRPT